jgi:hypothetical protein
MTIVSSGAISLGTSAGTNRSISAEYGDSPPHSLSEFYGADTGVPASGTISFSDFYGTSSNPVNLGADTTVTAVGSSVAIVQLKFYTAATNFEAIPTGNLGTTGQFDRTWLSSGSPSSYYVKVSYTVTSGDAPTPTGTFGSFLQLTSDRTWAWTHTTGSGIVNATVEVSNSASGSPVLDTLSLTIELN